jgi:hypothetical protein
MERTTYASRLRYLDADDLDDSVVDFDGLDVRGTDDSKLGEVDGFLVDPGSGRVLYTVVDSGGWFTSRRFLVPIGHATVNRERPALRVDISRDSLRNYPEFDERRFRELSDDELSAYEQRMASICCPDDLRGDTMRRVIISSLAGGPPARTQRAASARSSRPRSERASPQTRRRPCARVRPSIASMSLHAPTTNGRPTTRVRISAAAPSRAMCSASKPGERRRGLAIPPKTRMRDGALRNDRAGSRLRIADWGLRIDGLRIVDWDCGWDCGLQIVDCRL